MGYMSLEERLKLVNANIERCRRMIRDRVYISIHEEHLLIYIQDKKELEERIKLEKGNK